MPQTQEYRTTIEQILSLKWANLTTADLTVLMFVSLETAKEFAESLRIALHLYPNDHLLSTMAAGELKTSNLMFRGWRRPGDHWEFLHHFLAGQPPSGRTVRACEQYRNAIHQLLPEVRAMSIFSREAALPHVFSQILNAPAWNKKPPLHLQAFKYYLATHVSLDSKTGGHRDLVHHLPITNAVAPFYQARLNLYTSAIPNLT